MNAFRVFGLISLAAMLCLTGCSDSPPKSAKRVQVSGKVTLDSKPLTIGTITFDPGGGDQPTALDILDGSYEGRAPIGKVAVRLSAIKKISMKEKMKMEGPGYDQLVEVNMLPSRYNSESTITREVDPSGENKFNFDLKTN